MTAGLVSRTALVTGAGRGIGAAIATGFAEAGANVILLAYCRPAQRDRQRHLGECVAC
ncbi:SDR family NAD(P)-dependent oxidoreductase [Arthrobacter sp. ISL-28]|uniref:SDR family NAD(P)-dependent oxidoreductase n=1 Tax=Arthrobacter sp. ISL-28 TaxID=2819108 RepID=UPI001BE8D6BC|nr:SDR family NAD(P)-dependent oxidoreductase [Arthrobacter sp. ISL-28]MBT2521389.1 SDR family NAD(P)-dependent oxidoreductase [Arthrobacter sp. ISL-28]